MTTREGGRRFLFFHGFTSSPQDLQPVAERIRQDGWTVHTPALPGHAGSPEDLLRCRAADWLEFALQAWDAETRSAGAPVAVGGQSFGAVLALHAAAHRAVPAVIALAPALRVRDRRLWLLPVLKWIMPWKRDPKSDIKGSRFKESIYPRYPLRSVQEFLKAVRRVRAELGEVRAPLLGMQSKDDHTISPKSLDELMARTSSLHKEYHRLTNSFHVLTLDNEYEFVARTMTGFLARACANGLSGTKKADENQRNT